MPRTRSRSSVSAREDDLRASPTSGERGPRLVAIRRLRRPQAHAQRDQPGLRPVVQVTLHPAQLGGGGVDTASVLVSDSRCTRLVSKPISAPRAPSVRGTSHSPKARNRNAASRTGTYPLRAGTGQGGVPRAGPEVGRPGPGRRPVWCRLLIFHVELVR